MLTPEDARIEMDRSQCNGFQRGNWYYELFRTTGGLYAHHAQRGRFKVIEGRWVSESLMGEAAFRRDDYDRVFGHRGPQSAAAEQSVPRAARITIPESEIPF
jgi:hypothetical protein